MNIKEYIESGILEAYVLGALTSDERTVVEANIARYPELKDEMQILEESLLHLAEATSVQPPAHMQELMWKALQQSDKPSAANTISTRPKSIELPAASKTDWQRAAILIGLICTGLMSFVFLSQRNKARRELAVLQSQMNSVRQQQQQLASLITDYRKEMEMMADTNMQTIVMKSVVPGHPMAATVYWNKAKGETYLAMKKLPMPPEGMQYQMWVIQDGKPVSMGVLPDEMADKNTVARLPTNVTDGQAFAISLEKAGGSSLPTAENIYVLGRV